MGRQTSLKTSQRRGCNPLNPPPGSATFEPWRYRNGDAHVVHK